MKTEKNDLKNVADVVRQYRETTIALRDGQLGLQPAAGIYNGLGKLMSAVKTKIDRVKMIKSNEVIHFIDDATL
jgi:hypothetical protein